MSTSSEEPRQEAAFFSTIRNWGVTRGPNGVIGGVIEGVGDRIGMDKLPARIIAVAGAIILSGLVLPAYAAAWGLLPDRDGNIIIQNFGRGRPNVGALIGIVIILLIAPGMSDGWGGPWGNNHGFWGGGFISALLLAGIAGLIVWLVLRGRDKPNTDGSGPVYAVPPAASGAKATSGATAGKASSTSGKATKGAPKGSAAASQPASARAAGTAPPTPPAPPTTFHRRRTPGPGRALYLFTLAAAVFAGAVIWWLDREGQLEVVAQAAWLAVLVPIVGVAIMISGAAGRRVGFLGFLATVLVIGWAIGLLVVPQARDWVDNHVDIRVNGESVSIDDFNDNDLWNQLFVCHEFSESGASAIADGAAQVVATDSTTRIEVTAANTIISVPRDTHLTVTSESASIDGVIYWEEFNLRCDLEGTGEVITLGGDGRSIELVVSNSDARIVIEEN